jgi:hypothetical protein
MAHALTQDLEAFCSTCPDPEEVTGALQALGLTLIFQMDAFPSAAFFDVAALPAQYHYRDRHGTEVIYLQGPDANTDGIPLPEHASRFWAYLSRNAEVYRRITQAVATRWGFEWRLPLSQTHQDVA